MVSFCSGQGYALRFQDAQTCQSTYTAWLGDGVRPRAVGGCRGRLPWEAQRLASKGSPYSTVPRCLAKPSRRTVTATIKERFPQKSTSYPLGQMVLPYVPTTHSGTEIATGAGVHGWTPSWGRSEALAAGQIQRRWLVPTQLPSDPGHALGYMDRRSSIAVRVPGTRLRDSLVLGGIV